MAGKITVVKKEVGAVGRRRLTRGERRERILDSAARVLAERGYEAASLDEIAEAAGISKPVIYDHFASKKELHLTLLESQTEELLEFMTTRVAAETSDERQLVIGFDAFLQFVETHPYAWRLIFREPAAADAEILEGYRRVQRRATAAIAALTQAAPFSEQPDDPFDHEQAAEIVAVMLKAISNGVAAWWYEHREVPREALVQLMMCLSWVGLDRWGAGERWPAAPEEKSAGAE
jgi:AcrR family transcriptional regulator